MKSNVRLLQLSLQISQMSLGSNLAASSDQAVTVEELVASHNIDIEDDPLDLSSLSHESFRMITNHSDPEIIQQLRQDRGLIYRIAKRLNVNPPLDPELKMELQWADLVKDYQYKYPGGARRHKCLRRQFGKSSYSGPEAVQRTMKSFLMI